MRAVIQRVSSAQVTVHDEVVGRIGRGFLVLLGITADEGEAEARLLARKIAGLRVFEDADGKMNLALADVGGAVLAVSQFTLYADVRKGRRPSFIAAARPEQAAITRRPRRNPPASLSPSKYRAAQRCQRRPPQYPRP